MSCEWLEVLHTAGVDTQGSLQRFMNNEVMYRKFVLKFLEDENYLLLQKAVKQKDIEVMLTSAHTLKGVCGNLGFLKLYASSTAIVNAIRSNHIEEALYLYDEFEQLYKEMCEVINTVKRCS